MCIIFYRWSSCACWKAEPSINFFRWTLGKLQHSVSKDIREKITVKLDTHSFTSNSPLSLIQSENLICFLPPRDLDKGNNCKLRSVISSPFSSPQATFPHLPQGYSPTAYLLHQISQPSDRNTDQNDACDLSLPLPVTTCIASQALLVATVMSSGDFGPLTNCQLRPAHCLNCNDPCL